MVFNRFERFTSFKPPAMPVVYDVCPAWVAAWGLKSPAGPDGGNC
jgi:hypothetical protein